MTDLEAEQIQNSINVLQEMLDRHHEFVNRIRPQEKGLRTYAPNCDINWRLEGGILHHIEYTNTGNIDLSINVYQLHYGMEPMYENRQGRNIGPDAYGMCIGVVYVGQGNTETSYVGYPCSDTSRIMIEVKSAPDNEILEVIKVE